MANIQRSEFKHFTWTNITDFDDATAVKLQEEYRFHPLDIADCLSQSQRSKLDAYDKYTFLVILFPLYNYETREIQAVELDIFISTKYIITISDGTLKIFNDFFDLLRLHTDLRNQYEEKSPEKLLYEMLHRLFLYVFPIVDHLYMDCNKIEQAIFSGKEKRMISEILLIRRNITDLRKIMQVHKNVVQKAIITLKDAPLYMMKKTDAYYESLVDTTKEIWVNLENLRERIEALQQTNESQISFKLSDIMRILTIISVITFPVTLLATLFGMNTVRSMPFIESDLGFWYILGIMAVIITTMLTIFRRKGWM
ncbi:MAG: hypothetical protein A2840_01285 [Candidatus Buchananbacteria bacterium RIFCSPHIGHO2_01_FULL_47_11b]|uniref:Magnesium transport protein CorA n=1 Tax=Candidatus Buchananbacteria bacterium RIFCSPHIGHO2_01_FULL_47_11b TaxID=1797537 RepID=A0A1G1Y623_9BACT|nr:MAG: hypothetical protein A2840_01285 [Candidatus Buchananbacteria bacterium RIFCSPHIGHO2_01_FULL_47_11b]